MISLLLNAASINLGVLLGLGKLVLLHSFDFNPFVVVVFHQFLLFGFCFASQMRLWKKERKKSKLAIELISTPILNEVSRALLARFRLIKGTRWEILKINVMKK